MATRSVNKQEYVDYYMDFLITAINSSVKREANIDIGSAFNINRQADLENKKIALIVLMLISFIESNFLLKEDMKNLRLFNAPKTKLPQSVNFKQLASYIYIRDCVAHNPNIILFPSGTNTDAFINAINEKEFLLASIIDNKILIDQKIIHEIHLSIINFFGE